MGLDTHLVKGLTEGPYRQVGVFACHQVHLLEGTTVGFHSGKATHIDNHWGNTLQLVLTGLELT
jgi:hypothetical protein